MSWKFERNSRQAPTPSELAAINDYAASRSLHIERISIHGNHWYYWLRGKLWLSNIASIYIVAAQSLDGVQHHIHVAFDPWFKSKQLQVLLDRRVP